MTHYGATVEASARAVAEISGITLDVARLVACYSREASRQLLGSTDELRGFLIQNDPDHPCLAYEGPSSSIYRAITAKHSLDRDFALDRFGTMSLLNISYDIKRRSVAYMHSQTVTRHLVIKPVLHRLLPALDLSNRCGVSEGQFVHFIRPDRFSSQVLERMQAAGLISAPLFVPEEFLSD